MELYFLIKCFQHFPCGGGVGGWKLIIPLIFVFYKLLYSFHNLSLKSHVHDKNDKNASKAHMNKKL